MYLKQVKHIACYLSGSRKSAATAIIARNKGNNYLTAVFLKNPFLEDAIVERRREMAFEIAKRLEIPIKEILLDSDGWATFTSPVVRAISQGLSPCIDLLYNKHILFGRFLDKVIVDIGADYVAAGHFTRTSLDNRIDSWTPRIGNYLLKAVDQVADESYRLSQVPQSCLQKVYFPLGNIHHDILNKILEYANLDSVFTDKLPQNGSNHVLDALSMEQKMRERLKRHPADIFLHGRRIGQHEDIHQLHPGKQIEVEGSIFHVISKNLSAGKVHVVPDGSDPGLFCDKFCTSTLHWTMKAHISGPGQSINAQLRVLDHDPLINCTITYLPPSQLYHRDYALVSCSRPVRLVIPGHVAAFYQDEVCIGSSTILPIVPDAKRNVEMLSPNV